MMIRFLFSTALLFSGLLIPMTGVAYVSPEEALDAGDFSTRFFDPPPSSPREYERVAAEQQAESIANREAQLQAILNSELAEEATEETTHAAASAEDPSDAIVTSNDAIDREALIDARILERVKSEQEEDRLRAQIQWLAQTESLHSGAPLVSDTGPTSIAAVLLLLGTVGAVLWRAKKIEKQR